MVLVTRLETCITNSLVMLAVLSGSHLLSRFNLQNCAGNSVFGVNGVRQGMWRSFERAQRLGVYWGYSVNGVREGMWRSFEPAQLLGAYWGISCERSEKGDEEMF
jgi:hypothetical protein